MSIQYHSINFDSTNAPHAVVLVIFATILLSRILLISKSERISMLRYSVFWVMLFGCLILIYGSKDELIQTFKGELFPSDARPIDNGLVIKRSQNGHFMLNALVNGKAVEFMIDTGATSVMLSANDAALIGLKIPDDQFYHKAQTASGIAYFAKADILIKIGVIEIGPITASIAKTDGISLLGMAALNKFSAFEIRGDALTLYGNFK